MNLDQDLQDIFQDDDYVPPELAEFVAQAEKTLIRAQRSLQDDLHINDDIRIDDAEDQRVGPVDDSIPPLEDEQDDGRLANFFAQVKALESTPFEDDELDDDTAITKQFMAKFGLTTPDVVGGSDSPDGPNDAANIYSMLSSKGPPKGAEEKKTNPSVSLDLMDEDPKEEKPASKGGFLKSVFGRFPKTAPTEQQNKDVTPRASAKGVINSSITTSDIIEPSIDDDYNPAAFAPPNMSKVMTLGLDDTTVIPAVPEPNQDTEPMDTDPKEGVVETKPASTALFKPEDAPTEVMEVENPEPEKQVVMEVENPEREHSNPKTQREKVESCIAPDTAPVAKCPSSNISGLVQCDSATESHEAEEAPNMEESPKVGAKATVSQQSNKIDVQPQMQVKPATKVDVLISKQSPKADVKAVTQPRVEKVSTAKAPAKRIEKQNRSRCDQSSQSFFDRLPQPKKKAVPKTAAAASSKTSTRALPVSRALFSRKNQRKIAPLPVKNTQPAEDASTRAGALPPATSAVSEPKTKQASARNGTAKEKTNGKSGSHEVAGNKKQGESQATRVRATKPTARTGRTSLTSATTRSTVTPKPAVSQTSSQRGASARLAARCAPPAEARISATRQNNLAKASSPAGTRTSTQRKSPTSTTDAAITASAKKSAAAAAEARAAARKRVLMRQKEQEKKREEQLAKAKAAAAKKKVSKPLMASRLGIRSAENKTTARPRFTVPQGPRLSTSARHGGKPGRLVRTAEA